MNDKERSCIFRKKWFSYQRWLQCHIFINHNLLIIEVTSYWHIHSTSTEILLREQSILAEELKEKSCFRRDPDFSNRHVLCSIGFVDKVVKTLFVVHIWCHPLWEFVSCSTTKKKGVKIENWSHEGDNTRNVLFSLFIFFALYWCHLYIFFRHSN
jgi:hypothetical protein